MKRGSVNRDVRITNGKIVTNFIFQNEPMTKQDIASKLGISIPTVTTILNNLEKFGLIAKGDKQKSTGGRPAYSIMPIYSAAYSIGIFITPKHIRICLTDLAPSIVEKAIYDVQLENTKEYWQQVYECFVKFKKDYQVDENKLLGVGFALSIVPSKFESAEAGAITVFNGDSYIKIDTGLITEVFSDYSITINNEAKMAALAQAWSSPEFEQFTYLSLNYNVAGAMVSNRKVTDFEKQNAEFGHVIISHNGKKCVCGMDGCFDAYCSAHALQQTAGMPLQDFFEHVKNGDQRCLEIWDEYLEYLTIMLSNLRVVFDTTIVIGGIMSMYLTDYQNELYRRLNYLHRHHGEDEFDASSLFISELGEYGAAMGAGLIFNDHYLSNIFN